MKKHIIAAAVAAAVTVPAMAQNVTIYGVLEAGLENNKSTAGASTAIMDSHEFTSNRLGFRGEEDLGGGMKAFFRLESGTNITDGVSGASTNSTFFNRGAEVGLSGGFGRLSLGKQDHNGIEGNEISLVGNRGLFGAASVTTTPEVEMSGRASDLNDTISYTTPSFNGISVNVMYSPNDNGGASYAGSTATTHAGVTSFQAAGSISGVSFKIGGGTLKEQAGTKINVRGGSLSYNFGALTAAIAVQQQDNPAGTNDASESIISAAIPLGNGLTLGMAYASLDIDNITTGDYKSTMLMVKKDLSKRTALTGMYRSADPGASGLQAAKTTGVYVTHSF